ncbi:DEAD/DEAH box helicase [Herbaspirillum frisingense]|uniref:DEAD/DEAH box helicase n=1 Tax=Herbaspirillum frisingense TaxID=92645 RepID=UPI001600705D|nr:DEAD/DEAH box helicase [Herbaspirillum frisingense]QNB09259.1 DEAD/DEAH box helicase [Herbaspirillum frisingense]
MKPEFNSKRLYGITRSKGKMFEFGLPLQYHELKLGDSDEPQSILFFSIAVLADAAGLINDGKPLNEEAVANLEFSAKYFDALLSSGLAEEVEEETLLLAAAAYYLVGRPGSSLVMARKLSSSSFNSCADRLLVWILQADWQADFKLSGVLQRSIQIFRDEVRAHFLNGYISKDRNALSEELRGRAYESVHANDLISFELALAISQLRIASSSWTLLPRVTGIPATLWSETIGRASFPKELWPSQKRLADQGIFRGRSGIVQMPTSAGKTKAVEVILKSGFLSGRVKLAIIVAPFNALCNEIGGALKAAFIGEDVKVNELSDALQKDFLKEIAELFEAAAAKFVFVLTPEKLLYILRQEPSLADDIGLIIFDEAHQFDDHTRGVTYELLVTEIKRLIPAEAQTVLISAVIANARSVADWLMGEDAPVVDGTGLLPTARSVAFANWADSLGQLMFYESERFDRPDYFLPRVIESSGLKKKNNREKDRIFPDPESKVGRDVALYLGIKLVPQGSVAIFCGKKDQANDVAERAVDIFIRGYDAVNPSKFSDSLEVERLTLLLEQHYGSESELTQAGKLGIFVHHGNIHRGLRLSIEFAMQRDLIKFVVCTSTLAQGVNLPIRYLIVLSTRQSQHEIKVRDFQNLIGRAGRSGMHTEGLVIFSDPTIFGSKGKIDSEFDFATKLLVSGNSEATTSALLGIVAPFQPQYNYWAAIEVPVATILTLIYSDNAGIESWALDISRNYKGFSRDQDIKSLVAEVRRRKRLCQSLESFLMANRGDESFETFLSRVEALAQSTLAYAIASDKGKERLIELFGAVALVVQEECPDIRKQAVFAKTLLGVQVSLRIEQWATQNRLQILAAESNEELLDALWPIVMQEAESKMFTTTLPKELPQEIAEMWVGGSSFKSIFDRVASRSGTKPHGDKRHKLSADDILKFCENALSFECGLILGAVSQFLFAAEETEESKALLIFQKAMKYGVPDSLSISAFEYGFADRVLSQFLCQELRENGYVGEHFSPAVKPHQTVLQSMASAFPSYFQTLLP